MPRPTKLHLLLADKIVWDDPTWFQVQRYLLDNLSIPGMLTVVSLAGCTHRDGTRGVKTAAVKLLHDVPPNEVLHAWNLWRARR